MPRNKKKTIIKPIVAICYDFDKTLSPKDMQEYSLLPKLGCQAKEFWEESNTYAKANGMDRILSYMKLICEKCAKKDIAITEKDYKRMGKSVELFNGVDTWFDRINKFCYDNDIEVEHYIISAGLKEIIEGTPIAKQFTKIFASSFIFDSYGKPTWPRQVVNYTTKTQYLFRINKDCTEDLSDESSVNQYLDEEKRRIPFRNFVYIGDSETDIPAMKLVKKGNGYSIGVYNPSLVDIEKTSKLIQQNRINFFAPADYAEGSKLEKIVKDIIIKIKESEKLIKLNNKQKELMDKISYLKSFGPFVENELKDSPELTNEIGKLTKKFYNIARKRIKNDFGDLLTEEEIDTLCRQEEIAVKEIIAAQKKRIKHDKKNIDKNLKEPQDEPNDKKAD